VGRGREVADHHPAEGDREPSPDRVLGHRHLGSTAGRSRLGTARPNPLQLYNVRLLVKDFDRSWRFYRDTLGLTPNQGHGQPPYGEFVANGRPIVSIFDRKLMAKATGLASGRYPMTNVGRSALVFEVTDVDAVAARLRRKGVRLLQGPTDRPMWRLRTIHLRDPDGYLVEIFHNLPAP